MDWLTEVAVSRGQLIFSWVCFVLLFLAWIALYVANVRWRRRFEEMRRERDQAAEERDRCEERVRLYVDQEVERLYNSHHVWEEGDG